jgi:hypothetical protein
MATLYKTAITKALKRHYGNKLHTRIAGFPYHIISIIIIQGNASRVPAGPSEHISDSEAKA